jgi:two-component system KDP operon response regulator KdpE
MTVTPRLALDSKRCLRLPLAPVSEMTREGAIRVLIVDDDADLRSAVADLLSLQRRYVVASAGGLRDALAVAKELLPDVVLLDLGLPDGAPGALADRLRRETPAPALVVLSGSEGISLAAEQLGTPFFLRKPVGLAELMTTLDQALAHRDREQPGPP